MISVPVNPEVTAMDRAETSASTFSRGMTGASASRGAGSTVG